MRIALLAGLSIRAIAEADPAVARLVRALTMHLGPTDVLLTMEIQFRPHRAHERA